MTVFVHVGYPKTGTTWLQRTVFPNHPGIDFRPNKVVGWLKEISDADLKNGRPVVVSNEGLVRDSLWLHSRLGDGVKIIIVIREQVSIIESLYQQYVAEGGDVGFAEFLDGFLRADEESSDPCIKWPLANARGYLNYHRVAGYFRALFGPENVYVGLFEKLQEDQGAFLRDLTEFMGIDAFSLPEKALKRKENPSFSAVSSGLARYANQVLGNDARDAAVRRKWLKRADKLLFGLLPAKNAMDAKTRAFVKDHYRAGNKTLEANLSLPLGKYGYSV